MCNSISCFTNFSVDKSRYVKLPNGQLALITHIGTVRISQDLILHDVLCVPSFSFNLISVNKLILTLTIRRRQLETISKAHLIILETITNKHI
jgi:hypothetical protein